MFVGTERGADDVVTKNDDLSRVDTTGTTQASRTASKPDVITANATRIKFEDPDDDHALFTVERNVGQLSFDGREDAFIAVDSHDGEGGWFMGREEVRALHQWLGAALGEPPAVGAVDPHAGSTGTLSTRAEETSSSSSESDR